MKIGNTSFSDGFRKISWSEFKKKYSFADFFHSMKKANIHTLEQAYTKITGKKIPGNVRKTQTKSAKG